MKTSIKIVITTALLAGLGISARAAVIVDETFTDNAGWDTTGDLSLGVSGSGYLIGSFSAGAFGGSFIADSDSSFGNFVGDLTGQDYAGLTSLRFDFFSVDLLPSGFGVQFIGNSSTFTYNLSPTVVGSFQNFEVPMFYTPSWGGGNEADFNAMLANVQSVEVFIFPGFDGLGIPAQTYYLDNFTYSSLALTAIPEPGQSMLLIIGVVMVLGLRRRMEVKGLLTPETDALAWMMAPPVRADLGESIEPPRRRPKVLPNIIMPMNP